MIVSAWFGGGGYGLRVREEEVSLFFRPEWTEVSLLLPDETEPIVVNLTASFWTGAPELRSVRLKVFFERHDLIPWEKNRPPHFELEPIGRGSFRLKWLEKLEGQASLPLDV